MTPEPFVLSGLDEIDWSALAHAEGPAEDTPESLHELGAEREPERRAAFDRLRSTLLTEAGAATPAAAAAVPFLAQMAGADGFPARHRVLFLLHLLQAGGVAVGVGLPAYLAALRGPDWAARLYAPLVLAGLPESADAVHPAAADALAAADDPACRAALVWLLESLGEPIRTRWDGGLRDDPLALVRTVAALAVARQEGPGVPAEVRAVVTAAADPDPALAAEYARLPMFGDLAADAGAALVE